MTVCSVDWDAHIPAVVMTWNGYATTPQFRAANEQVLGAVVSHRASKLLGDATHFKLIAGEDQKWLSEDWIPRVIQSGLRHAAIVTPVYYFNKVAVATVSEHVDSSRLIVCHFDSTQDARRWLHAQ